MRRFAANGAVGLGSSLRFNATNGGNTTPTSATDAANATTGSSSSNLSSSSDVVANVSADAAKALSDARRQAFLESQAEWTRINQQQQRDREERLRREQSRGNTGLQSNTKVVSDVFVKRKKGPWGGMQLKDAWSSDAMSRHEKDNISDRVGSENRYNPFERDRRLVGIVAKLAVPSWILGLSIVYYMVYQKYPWEADYQHLLNILRQYDTSPRSKMYMYRADNATRRDAYIGPQ